MDRDFTQIHNAIIRANNLNPYQKSLICNILSNEKGFKISISMLMQRIPCGQTKVKATINELRQMNIIKVFRGKSQNNTWDTNSYEVDLEYLLEYIGVSRDTSKDRTPHDQGVSHDMTKGCTLYDQGVSRDTSKKNTNKNTKENTNKNTNQERAEWVSELSKHYSDCFRRMVPPIHLDTLMSFIEDGMELELVKYIMEYSSDKKEPWKYCKKVLENSANNMITTVDEFKANLQTEGQQKEGEGSGSSKRKYDPKEILANW